MLTLSSPVPPQTAISLLREPDSRVLEHVSQKELLKVVLPLVCVELENLRARNRCRPPAGEALLEGPACLQTRSGASGMSVWFLLRFRQEKATHAQRCCVHTQQTCEHRYAQEFLDHEYRTSGKPFCLSGRTVRSVDRVLHGPEWAPLRSRRVESCHVLVICCVLHTLCGQEGAVPCVARYLF